MTPPPRPPIICFDLTTNENARRAPCTGQRVQLKSRRPKVTVVQRDPNELEKARASACWHHHISTLTDEQEPEEPQNVINSRNTNRVNICKQRGILNSRVSNQVLVKSKPYQSNTYLSSEQPYSMLPQINSNNIRHAYGQRLKDEAEKKELRRQHKLEHVATLARLEQVTDQLELTKRFQENTLKTFGMGHNTAKYVQKLEEEIAKLKQKFHQFSEARSSELGRRVQQMKRCHELQQNQDRKVEEKRLRDMTGLTHCKHTLSSTLNNSLSSNSPTINTANNTTASSSSTISISSCSSPMSTDEPMPSIHFVETPPSSTSLLTPLPTSNILSSSTPSISRHRHTNSVSRLSHKKPGDKQFSFYKQNPLENETIEVTDIDFFEKAEDKTMMEVNELFNKLHSVLND